jgi:hypothetical protein
MKMASSAQWNGFKVFAATKQLHGFAIPAIRSRLAHGAKHNAAKRNIIALSQEAGGGRGQRSF